MVNTVEELGSISEHGNFSDSTKVDTRTEEDDDTDVDEVGIVFIIICTIIVIIVIIIIIHNFPPPHTHWSFYADHQVKGPKILLGHSKSPKSPTHWSF